MAIVNASRCPPRPIGGLEAQRLRSWKDERLQSYETERQHLHAVGLPFYWGAICWEVPGNFFGGSGLSFWRFWGILASFCLF